MCAPKIDRSTATGLLTTTATLNKITMASKIKAMGTMWPLLPRHPHPPGDQIQQQSRRLLVQGQTRRAAGGRDDTAGATVRAVAVGDRLSSRSQPALRDREPTLGETGSTRCAVVHDDGEQPGVGVGQRAGPADVPRVARCERR